MGKMKKQGESGEAAIYMSRNQALRKLQLTLKDFRKLCILKGIYPREPKNRKKAQGGSSARKTLYYKKDIQFLSHEPIIWKFREFKIFMRKVQRAIGKNEKETLARLRDNKPDYRLDHIVRERYPNFIDAVRDLDDALCLCFLFSTFPKCIPQRTNLVQLCHRLSIEFLHYVIATNSLRKVFVSIKGIYYQADIMGQIVTWITPHQFAFNYPSNVDFKIMSTFTEFYATMLGFVNFHLYQQINLHYPPCIQIPNHSETYEIDEQVVALNFPILKSNDANKEDEIILDDFPNSNNADLLQQQKNEIDAIKNLFTGLKIFLNREVPRESLTFIIRCGGGEVSWDSNTCFGATFAEEDESITHHIVDRAHLEKKYLSRYYIQPQWVYDSFNSRKLLPVDNYFMGAILPPHLSPFVQNDDENYSPFDKSFEEQNTEDAKNLKMHQEGTWKKKKKLILKHKKDITDPLSKMFAISDQYIPVNKVMEKTKSLTEEFKLREMMIRKKYKRLYHRMMLTKHRNQKEVRLLLKKRQHLRHLNQIQKYDKINSNK